MVPIQDGARIFPAGMAQAALFTIFRRCFGVILGVRLSHAGFAPIVPGAGTVGRVQLSVIRC
jgi:hypothetical protein